jgi:hypothetical protein
LSREEVPGGVRVVLARQGTRDFLGPKLGLSSAIFCEFADVCIDLDDALAADPVRLLSRQSLERVGPHGRSTGLLKTL